jgi:hypothetical protein
MRAYGASNSQQEAFAARASRDATEQLRIAENSDSRLVLLNLALNKNLEAKTVEALFDRDLQYVTKRLEALGYKKSFNLFG